MTGEEFKAALKRLGVPARVFGQECGASERTVYRWTSGEWPVPKYAVWIVNLLEARSARYSKGVWFNT